MNLENPLKNRIYSIAIPERNFDSGPVPVPLERDRPREGIAWFIPNSPPLPNDDYNYRRYRRGLERQPEIEMMLIDHQQEARRGQGRARVVPQPGVNECGRVRIRIRNLQSPSPVPANNGIAFPRWSLFQVWNNLAYVACSVPYRIAWEDEKGGYIIKYCRVQQVLFSLQQILSAIEMISLWRQFPNLFSNGTNPLIYVQFGSLVLNVTKRICYMTTTTFGSQKLLQVHKYGVNAGSATGYQIKMGKIMTIIASAGYSVYLFGYSTMCLALFTFRDQKGWDWGPAELLQTFACYARKIFVWGTDADCPDDIFLSLEMVPRREILYGCLGVLTYISATLAQVNTTLMIMSSSLSLLSASRALTSTTGDIQGLPSRQPVVRDGNLQMQRPLTTRYEFLEKYSGKISSFVGFIFLLSLGVMGLSFPNVLDKIFNSYEIHTLRAVLPIVMMIVSCLGACVSSMQIDAIEDKMTEMDNIEQLPNDIHRLIIYLHRLFRKSPGIGYRGIFVMNFVYLFTYCGAIAGFVAFTYENKKSEE